MVTTGVVAQAAIESAHGRRIPASIARLLFPDFTHDLLHRIAPLPFQPLEPLVEDLVGGFLLLVDRQGRGRDGRLQLLGTQRLARLEQHPDGAGGNDGQTADHRPRHPGRQKPAEQGHHSPNTERVIAPTMPSTSSARAA
ncbi:MAG: hypothetical protein IKE60_34615 [Reyranella sp.]|uniref:hypothetical protein n=1 Tax=Reyranella sp. TaxID=1929291 RepID=UPI0025D7BB88|nr:hypothetical protein [Reyranella sp.]MBR2819855.1 hypothetical protein [Reyranella sp.]